MKVQKGKGMKGRNNSCTQYYLGIYFDIVDDMQKLQRLHLKQMESKYLKIGDWDLQYLLIIHQQNNTETKPTSYK